MRNVMKQIKVELIGGPLDGLVRTMEDVPEGTIVHIPVKRGFMVDLGGRPKGPPGAVLRYAYRRGKCRQGNGDVQFFWEGMAS